MIKNYLKIALRNILKHKGYSAINILGLAGSMAVAILILFYVYQVFTYDQFHKDADRIYFMYRDRPTEEGRMNVWDTWYPMLEAARQDFPGIESGTRMLIDGFGTNVTYGERSFEERTQMVDSSFLDVFSYDLIAGNRATALDDPNNIILTKEMAAKYFGQEDPMGKTLTLGFQDEYVVTGVLGDIPINSSFDIDFIVPLSGSFPWVQRAGWRGSFLYTFIKVSEHTNVENLKPQLNELMDKYVGESERGNVLITPIAEFNDLFTERSKYATILLIVAIGIILIAAINFTNLATAQSMLRSKEVGVRKVMGAGKSRLIFQFLSESMLMAFIALIIGGLMAEVLMPLFSDLVDMPLVIDYLNNPEYVLSVAALWITIGLLSGFYPAIYLSRYEPSDILKGLHEKGGSLFMRNGLVVLQFSLAIILMSGVGIILSQVDFMKSYNTNFDQDNVMVVPISARDFQNQNEGTSRILTFKEELKQLPGVESVSASNSVPGRYTQSYGLFLPEDKPEMNPLDWQFVIVDDQYFQTYGVDLKEGNYFERTPVIAEGTPDRIILNEAAVKYIGWDQASGKSLVYPNSREKAEIVGVVEDFNVEALRNAVRPLVHYVSGDSSNRYRYLSIKMTPNSRSNTMNMVAQTWERMDFDLAYEYYFPAERFKELYSEEENMAEILTYASGLAIIIACLGLFALASFTVMLRTKEMAIRKVLGASITTIVGRFSKHFALLVIIAILIAVPATIYAMGKWLEGFAYQTSIDPMIFITTGVISLVIALISVGYHALKTGVSNPIDSLREE